MHARLPAHVALFASRRCQRMQVRNGGVCGSCCDDVPAIWSTERAATTAPVPCVHGSAPRCLTFGVNRHRAVASTEVGRPECSATALLRRSFSCVSPRVGVGMHSASLRATVSVRTLTVNAGPPTSGTGHTARTVPGNALPRAVRVGETRRCVAPARLQSTHSAQRLSPRTVQTCQPTIVRELNRKRVRFQCGKLPGNVQLKQSSYRPCLL